MKRKKFAKLKHRIVGISGEFAPELVDKVHSLLTKLESKLPAVKKNI